MPEKSIAAITDHIRERIRQQKFRLSKHAVKRMDGRGRTLLEITQVILSGEVIREYPDEKPYPEYLFLGYPHRLDDPCYVVVASNGETVIVTVHEYDPEIYEPDHRTRRAQK